ncbi:hypothetical protein [Ohtaekwangia sp.]
MKLTGSLTRGFFAQHRRWLVLAHQEVLPKSREYSLPASQHVVG